SERGQAFDGFGQGDALPNSASALPEIYEPSPAGSQPAAVQRVSTPLPEIWGEGAAGMAGAAGSLASISAGSIAASAGAAGGIGAADMAGAAGIASSFGAVGMAGAAGGIGVAGVAGAGAAGAADAVAHVGASLNSLSSLDIPDPLTRRTSEPLPDPLVGIGSFAQDAAARAQGPASIPNTVMFAAGQGNAHPLPNSNLVRACLLNTDNNRTFDLATSRLLIGRDGSNDVVVDDINASRSHAEISFQPQGVWVIADLGSTNGTLVNGQEVVARALHDGDYITIGMTNFVFVQA
ncbi:MAG: FHA domain-containing protein, partial [Eggerthellaceae bacterium]|nr:FHA domain-containing protein [Eggerthellaceae bacterium]